MPPVWWTRAIPILRLARVSTAFAAVSNVWFVILWSRAHEFEQRSGPVWEMPLVVLLLAGGAMAVGMYAFGAALNDLLDVSRDRAFKRPRTQREALRDGERERRDPSPRSADSE